jgi:hypothetical protein
MLPMPDRPPPWCPTSSDRLDPETHCSMERRCFKRSGSPGSVIVTMPIGKVTTPSEISFFICASTAKVSFKSLADQSKDIEGGACRALV